jgi:hypothetical protein
MKIIYRLNTDEANRRHLPKEMKEAQRGENIVSFTVEEFENLR